MKLEPPTPEEVEAKSVKFGEYTRQKTLIFDLDETLINSYLIVTPEQEEMERNFEFNLKTNERYGVSIRPYMMQCLEHLSEYYEIAVFTAAE